MSTTNTMLTPEQIIDAWDRHIVPAFGKNGINPIVFARAIEQLVAQEVRRQTINEIIHILENHMYGYQSDAIDAIREYANADPVHPDHQTIPLGCRSPKCNCGSVCALATPPSQGKE